MYRVSLKKLGIRKIIIPKMAGVGSALGFLYTQANYQIAKSILKIIHEVDLKKINSIIHQLILKDLDKIDGFYDKWWRTESSQLEAFIRVVQNRRADLSQRFIVDSVTRTLRG